MLVQILRGIPLKEITKDMPESLLKDVCITHFFNPVKVMKLCELIPGGKNFQRGIRNIKYFFFKEYF